MRNPAASRSPELFDEIYAEFGFYAEQGQSLTMEGAEGATQIQRLVDSYAAQPPREARWRGRRPPP